MLPKYVSFPKESEVQATTYSFPREVSDELWETCTEVELLNFITRDANIFIAANNKFRTLEKYKYPADKLICKQFSKSQNQYKPSYQVKPGRSKFSYSSCLSMWVFSQMQECPLPVPREMKKYILSVGALSRSGALVFQMVSVCILQR